MWMFILFIDMQQASLRKDHRRKYFLYLLLAINLIFHTKRIETIDKLPLEHFIRPLRSSSVCLANFET